MGSKYPRSMRGCLPLWTITVQAALILVFFFFTKYDSSSKDHKTMRTDQVFLQDVTIMVALGLGFLPSSLWRYGWSSVGFNLFMLALGAQWAVLLDSFLDQLSFEKVVIKLHRIQQATMSALSVLISAGAVLGRVNLLQLLLMVLMEVTVFGVLKWICKAYLRMDDHSNMMHMHVFAAYFGLTVAWYLSRPLPKGAEKKDQRATSPSLFAMLGTLFLWMFWPSFNSALLPPERKMNTVINTYYALAVSAVTATSLSALVHPQGKISMVHVHNAVLAGGVAVGIPSDLIPSPWLAMLLGLVAGLISIMGANCLPVYFNPQLGIRDTCGVHYTFGFPGLLGGVVFIMLKVLEREWTPEPPYQVLLNAGVLSSFVAMGLISGLLTGLLLKLKIWKASHIDTYFNDQAFWEFPHLAVGF